MQNKSVRLQSILLTVLVVGVIALLGTVVVMKMHKVSIIMKEIEQEKMNLTTQKQRLDLLQKIEGQSETIQAWLIKLNNMLPDAPSENEVINQLEDMAVDCGIQMTEVKLNKEVENENKDEHSEKSNEDNIEEIPLSLSFSGEYYGIVELIGKIKSGKRLLRINEILIKNEEQGKSTVTAEMNVSAFILKRVNK